MNNCSCIKGNYNFYTKSIDIDTIVYQDMSIWMDEKGYILPDEYEVDITLPTSFKPKRLTLKVNQLNRLSSKELGSIKDGIYCFETTSCGEPYKRCHAIFPYMECCIKKAWTTLDKEKSHLIREVEYYLNLSKINAELDNVQLASKQLKVARKLLDNLKCDCDC